MAQRDRKNPSGTYDGQSADRSRGGSDRRDQGGMPVRPNDEALARRTGAEREELSREREDVPPADDVGEPGSEAEPRTHREARREAEREAQRGQLETDADKRKAERPPYPPTRYDP